ncbi:hypothetical protein BDU57DRAFT_493299 [Ampelomyces quisqualis]|uniref:Uncharacterized protein n=1 Tax=Ampelomyces quisqualis TaxID=50730 RepID=A0A6A5QPU4_AMPQU|nr:hypothetical protein BDU57DRAFT_493299 [Ampelomyces quisqualis]
MESAALTRAHEHVRIAATATLDNRVATAGQQHDFAAAAFHEAVQDAHNAEALRILSLLQDHHRKLAGLIKEAPRKERQPSATSHAPESTATKSAAPSTASSTPPASRRRLPQSSIASNLAEKRGIPTARRTTSGTAVNVAGAIGGREDQGATPVRDLLAQQSRRPASSKSKHVPKQQTELSSPKPASPPPDDNFRRFYSAFGGVISAISAPLAFTSLPLNPAPPALPAEPTKEDKQKTKTRTQSPEALRTVKASVPDLAALISKPALRALRQDGNAPLGPNESFYLVPGTASYASFLQNKKDVQNQHLSSTEEGSGSLKGSSHEEFVDARENVGPPSPTKARHARTKSGPGVTPQQNIPAGRGSGLKTMEELTLENETLKALVDKQAKRIQMWELNSQRSFDALAQSFRARGPGRNSSDVNALTHALPQGSNAVLAPPSPPIPSSQPTSPGPQPDSNAARRIAHLEALLASQTAKVNDLMSNNDHLAKQNEKNSQVIGRYREQWEKLKAGARKKEQERRERRVAEVKAGEAAKDSESGEAEADGVGDIEVEEAGFGKA